MHMITRSSFRGKGVTEIHDVARELAMEAGLNVATAWISGLEPSTTEQEIERDSTVLDERRESLRPEFAARDVIAVDYATHLNMSLPSTTPIAWTRGLREDGTWDKQGSLGGAGGYIVFMGGNVTYYENLNAGGGQLRRADGTRTANILEALPPEVRVVGAGPGTLHGTQGKAPEITP